MVGSSEPFLVNINAQSGPSGTTTIPFSTTGLGSSILFAQWSSMPYSIYGAALWIAVIISNVNTSAIVRRVRTARQFALSGHFCDAEGPSQPTKAAYVRLDNIDRGTINNTFPLFDETVLITACHGSFCLRPVVSSPVEFPVQTGLFEVRHIVQCEHRPIELKRTFWGIGTVRIDKKNGVDSDCLSDCRNEDQCLVET